MIGLKDRDLVINKENPFINDSLDRLESAEALTNFLKTVNEPTVLCINAPWGEGKTTFLKMWQQSLKNDHFPTVYFNSWENDFSNDALVCLIGELESAFDSSDSKSKDIYKKLKKLGAASFKRTLPFAVKQLTLGLIDSDDFKKDLANLTESIAKEQLQKYSKSKKSISQFKKQLKALAEELSQEENPRPLVFIIDELDRCRPNFSIEVLEKAKHFFNVDNVVFVLGVDKIQLGSSFKAIYGQDLDVANYLRRFIDFEYKLPTPKNGAFTETLFKRFSINMLLKDKEMEDDNVEECLSDLFNMFGLTLRQQENCCAILSLAIRVSKPKDDLLLVFLSFLIVVKIRFPELYVRWLEEKLKPDLLIKETDSEIKPHFISNHFWHQIEAYAEALSCTDDEGLSICENHADEDLHRNLDLNNFQFESEYEYEKVKLQVRLKAIDRVSTRRFNNEDVLGFMLSKIDLVSRFQENLSVMHEDQF